MTPPLPPLTPAESDRLRLFISSVTDYAIYMLTPEGYVASWNAGAQRFKGYTPDEIVGQHFSRFYTEEDRETRLPWRALDIAKETGKFEAEGWRVRKDGTRFWASVVIDPIRDDDGQLLGFAKITRDITDKKQAQDALRESEQRFRMLVQGVSDYAIYMLSPTGEVTNWNTGARSIKGYDEDEVVGRHFSHFYTPEDRDKGVPTRALSEATSKGRYEAEGWRVRKDGTRFWAHVVIDAIRNDGGEIVGFAKITRDITERKEATKALELAREALFQSQKLEAIGKLTGGVAHDFNNLLNVVGNGLEMLRQRAREPADLRLIDTMAHAVSRGGTLTQQLLSFARQQPMKREPRDLSRVIRSFEAVLRRASRNLLQFDLDLAPSLPPALVDSTQFEAGLLNLIVNARDATADGGRISVTTRVRQLKPGEVPPLEAGAYVEVAVEDTGTGMSSEVLDRAIEPFFTTKEVGKGTGLGLSQVYGMVQQCNGAMHIRSAPNEGTTVSMFFPVDESAVAMPAEDLPEAEKVLVVDDQPEVLEVTCELFRTLGLNAIPAVSPREAINILQRTPDISFMLTDVMMPGMSGVELAQRAREIQPGMRVILASGYSGPAHAGSGGELEGFAFLAKPYKLGDIVRKLRELA
ncbi:MAG TPA: PAS domain S-box protein [Ramlibacter sp.]|nr:PAS domain S-box protein [Ramlibacter sp.]